MEIIEKILFVLGFNKNQVDEHGKLISEIVIARLSKRILSECTVDEQNLIDETDILTLKSVPVPLRFKLLGFMGEILFEIIDELLGKFEKSITKKQKEEIQSLLTGLLLI